MNKTLKILLIIIGAVVALILAAALILPLVVKPNQYKGLIEKKVAETTGREFEIAGDIDLSVFPWLGVSIGEVRLANAPGFGDEPMVSARETQVRVQLLPLLSKKVVLDTIVLEGLTANLGKNAQGTTSWNDILQKMEAEKKPEPEQPEPEQPQAAGMPVDLQVEGVRLVDANIVWNDRQADTRYTLSDLDVTVGGVEPGQPFDLTMVTGFAASAPEVSGNLELASTVTLLMDKKEVHVTGMELDMALEKFVQQAADGARSMNGTVIVTVDRITSAWDAGTADINSLRLVSDLSGSALPGGTAKAELDASARVDWKRETAQVPSFKATFHNVVASGNAGVKGFAEPDIDGSLQVAEFSPKKLMELLGLDPIRTADPDALTNFSARMDFSATKNSARLRKLEARLDQTALNGQAEVSSFEGPVATFALAADTLNVDRYMPPKDEEGKPAPEDEKPADGEPGPSEALKSLDLAGTMRVDSLTAMKVKAANVKMEVTAKNGTFRVDPLTADMYQGKVRANASATLLEKITNPTLKLDVSSLQIGPLLDDYLGKLGWIGGATSLNLDLKSQGGDAKEMLKTLTGLGDLVVQHGVIRGFTLVPGAVNELLNTSAVPSMEKETEFDKLAGSFAIDGGELDFKKLLMVEDSATVESQGAKVDLVDEKLSIPMTMISDKLPQIKGLDVNKVPLLLKGDFQSLSLAVDQEGLQGMAKEAVESRVKGKLQEELGKKLDPSAGDTVKQFLDGGTSKPAPQEKQQPDSGKNLEDTLKEGLGGMFGGQKK